MDLANLPKTTDERKLPAEVAEARKVWLRHGITFDISIAYSATTYGESNCDEKLDNINVLSL